MGAKLIMSRLTYGFPNRFKSLGESAIVSAFRARGVAMHRMIHRLLSSLLAMATLTVAIYSGGAAATTVSPIPVSMPNLCNSVAYHEIPGNPNFFVGRRLINTTSDPCSGTSWTLSLFQMNWSSNAITYVRDILAVPAALPSQNGVVRSAYDPSIIAYGGELWIAFECTGTGTQFGNTASSCIAPLSSTDYSVTTSRMAVVVSGVSQTSSADGYSASVPKFLLYQGVPYLYWSVSHFSRGADGPLLTDTTTRGTQLVQETAASKRLWVNGSVGVAIQSVDSQFSSQVLGIDPSNPLLNNVADSFDVQVVGSRILLLAGVGGKGCLTSAEPAYGCYRLEIRSSTTPLGNNVFNTNILSNPTLPFNPNQYSKMVVDPSGNTSIMGYFGPTNTTGSPAPSSTIPVGMARFAIDASTFQFASADPTPTPFPTYTTTILSPTFTMLQQFVSTCSSANPRPSPGNIDCLAAVGRYCSSQGYGAGGVLEEYDSVGTSVACVTSGGPGQFQVDIGTLSGYQSACTASNLVSGPCQSAIGSFCRAQGYPDDGFGPLEAAGSSLIVTCLGDQASAIVGTTFTALAQQNTCSSSDTASGSCFSSASRYCQQAGYLTGYGIIDYNQNNALVGCFKTNVPH